jgi:ketosteroid isomerase-like protein
LSADERAIASKFRLALESAYRTGDREPVYALLAPDVEWVTPKRTLNGIDEVKEQLIWGDAPEKLDTELEDAEWEDLGDGRLGLELRHVYRLKSGEFAYERRRRIELTIRDGMISRYEMRVVG